MTKITIDEKACEKHDMTLQEVLFALAIRISESPIGELLNMENKEILIKKDDVYMVTQHWSDVLDEILADSSGKVKRTDEEITALAKKMRESYAEGRMIDLRTGKLTPYYFRCNESEVKKKLKTFFTRYGNYSDEDILDAEKRYLATFNGNYQQRGFRILKYFILKDDVKEGPDHKYVDSISPLLDFLENKDSDFDRDWTTKIV